MDRLTFISCEPLTQPRFAAWVEGQRDDDHYELLDGFVVREPPAAWPHGWSEARLVARLVAFVDARQLGYVFGSSQGFELSTGDTVEPDVSFVAAESFAALGRPPRAFLRVVPDLIVEIASPSTAARDHKQKKRIYERAGVREYWIADPEARTITRFVRAGDAFGRAAVFGNADTATSEVLSGFELHVAEVFPAL